MSKAIIGIDPGTHTGFAHLENGELFDCTSLKIHQAMRRVELIHASGLLDMVVYEDARLRRWFGTKGVEALQGAGSVKRDCTIWADFLADLGCTVMALAPAKGMTKLDARSFQRLTGWQWASNEHGRDAAMLVWGRK